MTTGQMVFYSGVALLAVTVLLAVVFIVKKPQYIPEQAHAVAGPEGTQKLRNGYPTAPQTKAGKATEAMAKPAGATEAMAKPAGTTEAMAQPAGATEAIRQDGKATELMTAPPTERMAVSASASATEELV